MEQQQELEWKSAQSIEISVDIVSAAKKHLKFLAAIDRNRWLYQGAGLDRAIRRYNACWLPLLAKHSASPLFEGPLVVPLDCEWVWHCHRLNPVRFKQDCQEFYGRLLDCKNVVSSLEGISRKPTEEMWAKLFPGEPYELESKHAGQDGISGEEKAVGENWTKYDLISAVQRQTPFFYQVSRLHMNDDRYIEGAVARYKGFLHLIKRSKEMGIRSFAVPTYDIDLIWHTHQLHPVSYCQDLVKILGKILEHDDTDSDRTKGQKLEVGFSGTSKTFARMYGRRYWRAGALYTGDAPSPVRVTPYSGTTMKKVPSHNQGPKVSLPAIEVFEVMLEFVGVRNLPEGQNGSLSVSFSKSQPDIIFKEKRTLPLLSESGEKQVATFQCQPTGNLHFELISTSSESSTTMGAASMSLEDILSPHSNLTSEKWLDLTPSSDVVDSKPLGLRVAISVTVPTTAPYKLHMARSQPAGVQFPKKLTSVVDEHGNTVINLQMRNLRKPRGKKGLRKRLVVGITETGKTSVLAAFAGLKWSMVDSPWSLKFPNANNDDGHLLEMTGPYTVRLYPGGRLDYESKHCEKHKHECHLITAVKFSAQEPYGTAVASLDTKSGKVEVKEEWFLLPALVVTFVIGNILMQRERKQVSPVKEVDVNAATANKEKCEEGGGCGVFGGCGGCGTMADCGACFGVTSGSCWGVTAKSGSCGGTCGVTGGGSCWGVTAKSGGGSCWGSGGGSCWGVTAKSGGCGGTCGVTGGGSCWGVTTESGGGSCWGNGGGSCWGAAAKSGGGSCWGSGGGSCWGAAAKSGGGSCWGSAGGSCWGAAAKSGGGSCWGSGGGSCWGVTAKSGGCWGGVSGGGGGCGVASGSDGGVKSQTVAGTEVEVGA